MSGSSDHPLPRQRGAGWDERRNTSRVFPVPVAAPGEYRRQFERLRHEQPALVQWILDGHPTLTEAEHLGRFGEPYRPRSSRTKPAGSRSAQEGSTS